MIQSREDRLYKMCQMYINAYMTNNIIKGKKNRSQADRLQQKWAKDDMHLLLKKIKEILDEEE